MSTIVTTQEELAAAIESGAERIIIDSPAGVWLEVRGSSSVEARESSCVVALGSSRVEARGSSRVEARGSSRVVACDSSRVEACESSRVVACDSSHVEAWGSSHVEARGSSHVEARGSSRVVAWGSSHVEAWGSSHVEAAAHVAVHLHSAEATVIGGVVIDIASLDLSDPHTWAAHHCGTDGDTAIVYKAVDADLVAGQGHIPTTYPIGEEVTATDWNPAPACGHGLHFSPSPTQASGYYQGDGDIRYLACEVSVATLVPLGDKCKAPSCRVLREVDIHADPIEKENAA